jgi:hypothetical protein
VIEDRNVFTNKKYRKGKISIKYNLNRYKCVKKGGEESYENPYEIFSCKIKKQAYCSHVKVKQFLYKHGQALRVPGG